MTKPKILIQLDPDAHPSAFDSVVAIDSGVDHLLRYSAVTESQVESIVHGAIFTRGVDDLKSTALFIGGSHVEAAEALVARVERSFFGPMRVSLMSDPNGSNTTAAAAVICAQKHLDLKNKTVTILAGTGPVGIRIAHLIAGPATPDDSTQINICSRRLEKAESVCQRLKEQFPAAKFNPSETATSGQIDSAVSDAHVIFAAGAAGVGLIDQRWKSLPTLKVAIDLNGVPPSGIAGINALDKAQEVDGKICYGAIGVGGLKMKIHKRAVALLFQSNSQSLKVEEIFAIGQEI